MKKFKYYVLTSGHFRGLMRHVDPRFSNIPPEDLVVVINTTSEQYIRMASRFCKDLGIEYHITESDGTPGTGKNSLFEVFLESDNDYMVQIDGDDFLTPHGVWLYRHLAQTESPPDAICLISQIGLDYDWKEVPKITGSFLNDSNYPTVRHDKALWPKRLLSPFDAPGWEHIKDTSIVDYLSDGTRNLARAKRFNKYNQEFYRLATKYVDANDTHSRIVWLSRKAVENKDNRFCDLNIGEDTIFYYKIKHQGLTGQLDVKTNVEMPATYVYDQTTAGIVSQVSGFGTDYNWMYKFNKRVRELEKKGMLHAEDLPMLQVDYPYDYRPKFEVDEINFVSLYDFPYEVYGLKGKIRAPANSSEKTLMDRYNNQFKKVHI